MKVSRISMRVWVHPVWEAKAILCSQVSGSEFVHQNGSLMRNRYRAELLDSTTYSHEIALSPRCRLPPMSWLSAYLEPLCTLSNTYIFHRWEWSLRIILSWRKYIGRFWIVRLNYFIPRDFDSSKCRSFLSIKSIFEFLSFRDFFQYDWYFKLFKWWWSFIFIFDLGKIIRNY